MSYQPLLRKGFIKQRRRGLGGKVSLSFISLLLIVILLLIFPVWTGAVWHFFNGTVTPYAGWIFPVPTHFFAIHKNGSLFIVRLEPKLMGFGRSDDMVVIVHVYSQNYFVFERDFPKFEQVESASAADKGLTKRSTKRIRNGVGTVSCLEFGSSGSSAHASQGPEFQISCFVEGETTTINYTGRESLSADVYAIIRNMSKPRSENLKSSFDVGGWSASMHGIPG